MRWPLTLVVDGFPLKEGVSGCAIGPVIFIREGYEKDEGLAQHELTHVKQFAYTLGLFGLLYLLSRSVRKIMEVEAYKEQMKYPDRDGKKLTLELAAYRLALPLYDLGLTLEQAKAELA